MENTSHPALEVEDVHKSFGPLEVLKGISLTAHVGDVIALIGSSGSGKSTFLRCINLLETPDKGIIRINDEQIKMKTSRKGEYLPADSKQVERIRTRLGMVFQQFNLWEHMTVLQNVIEAPVHVLGKPKKEMEELAMELLNKVGIAAKSKDYPSHLSGGQQQRVAIARALAMQPDVILFDEPTSALDPEMVGEVLNVMESLAEEGRTMIIATHEMDFAQDVSSHVMFLHQGHVEEQGPPKQVFQNPKSEICRNFLSRFLGNGDSTQA